MFGVTDSRIAERERSIDGSRDGRGLIQVFRCWVRPGGTNAAADVAGSRIAPGRRRRTDKHKNTELRRELHAWDGRGRPKGVGHESSPALGRKTAAVACGRKARNLRRNGGAACSEGPGPREGPGAKAPCAQQSTRTAHSLKLAQSAAALLTHNRYCSSAPTAVLQYTFDYVKQLIYLTFGRSKRGWAGRQSPLRAGVMIVAAVRLWRSAAPPCP